MATVTGTLKDFGLAALAPYSPTLNFIPSGPARNDTTIFGTRTISVTPAADGSFSVDLVATDGLQTVVWYTLTISWLNSTAGYTETDFPDWKLYVPAVGGTIGGLITAPTNPALVYTSLTAPVSPTPGTWWLESNPDNINDTANTGNLYEWSN